MWCDVVTKKYELAYELTCDEQVRLYRYNIKVGLLPN